MIREPLKLESLAVSRLPIEQLVKNPPAMQETQSYSWVQKIPLRKDRLTTPVFLGFPGGSDSKVSTCIERDVGSIPGLEDPLEKDMATHPNILAWEIPWTEEPDGLQSMESQRVGHGSVTKQQPQIPLFLWSLTFLSVTKTQKNQA